MDSLASLKKVGHPDARGYMILILASLVSLKKVGHPDTRDSYSYSPNLGRKEMD